MIFYNEAALKANKYCMYTSCPPPTAHLKYYHQRQTRGLRYGGSRAGRVFPAAGELHRDFSLGYLQISFPPPFHLPHHAVVPCQYWRCTDLIMKLKCFNQNNQTNVNFTPSTRETPRKEIIQSNDDKKNDGFFAVFIRIKHNRLTS